MKADSQKYLDNLLAQGEHLQQDFKFQINDAAKIAISIVAFANTKGGKLLIGVKDNAKVAGIRTEEEVYMIDAAAKMYCKPELTYKITEHQYLKKRVLEVDIVEGLNKPYSAKDNNGKYWVYFRVDDQNLLANIVQIKYWEKQKRKEQIVIKYGKEHRLLFDYIAENKQISFTKAKKITKLPHVKLLYLLVDLLLIQVLKMDYKDNSIAYSFHPSKQLSL